MKIEKLIYCVVLCMGSIMTSCKGDVSVVKRVWESSRLICGFNIEDIPESIAADLKRLKNKTSGKLALPDDKIVISYEDFRCCIKKTLIYNNMRTEDNQRECMELVMECIRDAEQNHCTLTNSFYLQLAFSKNIVILFAYMTAYCFVATIFACISLRNRIQRYDQRRERDLSMFELI